MVKLKTIKFKKLLALMLAFVLAFGTVPVTAAADSMEATFAPGQPEQSGLPLGDYYVDFSPGHFPNTYEAYEGQESLALPRDEVPEDQAGYGYPDDNDYGFDFGTGVPIYFEPFSMPAVTVAFDILAPSVDVGPTTSLLDPITVTSFALGEAVPNNAMSPHTPVHFRWVRLDGNVNSGSYTTNFNAMGINPNDGAFASSLVSNASWSVTPMLELNGAGDYVLRVYVGSTFVAEGGPVSVAVSSQGTHAAPSLFTVTFNNIVDIALTAGDNLGATSNMMNFNLSVGFGTGLDWNATVGSIEAVWLREDGAPSAFGPLNWDATSMNYIGIDPTNPMQLISNNMPLKFPPVLTTPDHAGYYRLRVSMQDASGSWIQIGESSVLEITVTPAPVLDLDLVGVAFTNHFMQLSAVAGDFIAGFEPISFNIELDGTGTGLTTATSVELVWMRDGDTTPVSREMFSLQDFGIDPSNPAMLTSTQGMRRPCLGNWTAHEDMAGTYRLHVYIAGQLVSVSDPVTIQILPCQAWAALEVDFDFGSPDREFALPIGEVEADFEPIIAEIDLVAANTPFESNTEVRLYWWFFCANQRWHQEWTPTMSTLADFGIDPGIGSLSGSFAPPHPVSDKAAEWSYRGYYVLRVIIDGYEGIWWDSSYIWVDISGEDPAQPRPPAPIDQLPVPGTFAVIVSNAGTGATGDGYFAPGAPVSISAGTAPAGYTFYHWAANPA